MNKQEKLKRICNKIWYEKSLDKKVIPLVWNKNTIVIKDEREVIFDPEFIDKYKTYYHNKFAWWVCIDTNIMKNLDNITEYIYNLIK